MLAPLWPWAASWARLLWLSARVSRSAKRSLSFSVAGSLSTVVGAAAAAALVPGTAAAAVASASFGAAAALPDVASCFSFTAMYAARRSCSSMMRACSRS